MMVSARSLLVATYSLFMSSSPVVLMYISLHDFGVTWDFFEELDELNYEVIKAVSYDDSGYVISGGLGSSH